jgi:predicted RNA-binding protein with TRAM domain
MYGNNFGGQRSPNRFAPVKQGEELDVTIETVGEKGDGIAKKNGFVLFVPNVKEGDKVKIRVNKVLKKVGFAEVIGKSDSNEQSNVSQEEPEEEVAEEEISEEEMENDSEDFGEDDSEESTDSEDDSTDEELDDEEEKK